MLNIGASKVWRDGDIWYAENDMVRMAYVVSDDRSKAGSVGWHNDIVVEFVTPEQEQTLIAAAA